MKLKTFLFVQVLLEGRLKVSKSIIYSFYVYYNVLLQPCDSKCVNETRCAYFSSQLMLSNTVLVPRFVNKS